MHKFLMTAAAAATSLALAPAAAHAGPPKWAPGHNNSAAHYAPGQVKKRHHSKHSHSKHSHDHNHDRYEGRIRGDDWVYVDDYGRWGLEPPRDGHRYVRQDNKIFEVVKDTLAIVGAVAVVNALTQ
ncbi:hypothetical protein [Leisingera aquaemixtae]|uniref:Putative integral membrane protein n=1 Tax=Leisingera aquaemixtae TaxID=1396826 RepID=A0A0P1HBU7_9RHOB|nr:hypothetical protein [Leisingera aquaemixtae]CUI00739.1 putative integral membrane protein [Leisingera aquaemixtae]